ncbi:hypothetical protein PWG68_06740 [Chromobacterium amazonense]|uniref:hypothetical protein n=1 Tax=Chromobacterium amazonense TaxID=1382803 RepID=UPI00237DD025|nr:hypothetical protein [Chromobacterium amazonense]MDE1713758.1 hypothetical protein [Chromobacterium amazonense]
MNFIASLTQVWMRDDPASSQWLAERDKAKPRACAGALLQNFPPRRKAAGGWIWRARRSPLSGSVCRFSGVTLTPIKFLARAM